MHIEPDDPRVQAALRDYLQRIGRGERIDVEAFAAEHHEIGDDLRVRIAEIRRRGRSGIYDKNAYQATQSFSKQDCETVPPRTRDETHPQAESQLPERFGRYRILRTLGRGAMGTVYLAEDAQLGRQVALKTPHFENDPTGALLARFDREARTAATLRHPNLCPVYDVGRIGGKHYISMAYIEGRPLSDLIQHDKPQSERQILILVRKLAQALQEAHENGIVHRDLKPANVMIDKRGEPIIMDFGLAQQLRREGDIRLTQSGALLGTPAYMSPEQVEGDAQKIGPSTDQYSLGVIFYELLTGELPFRGSVASVLGQIVTKNPTPPGQLRADLDLRIEAACLRMMAKDSADRFPSLVAVADELAAILRKPSGKTTAKSTNVSQEARASGARAAAPAPLTQSELASMEELARKCYSRRDYEQVVQILERIPEECRSATLKSLLAKARERTDEIAYLIAEIEEAVRFNDRRTALRKAEELLKIKPGHHRAREIQKRFSGFGAGGAARIGLVRSFAQPWREGGWVPWSALGIGILVFGAMTVVIQAYLRTSATLPKTKFDQPTSEIKKEPTVSRPPLVPAKVAIASVPAPAATTVSRDGFVSLFNGRDLTGWSVLRGADSTWRVTNGVIVGTGPVFGFLRTQRDDYRNFHLRVEARLNKGGNGGVYFRSQQVEGTEYRDYPSGYEADINDPDKLDSNRTGALFIPRDRSVPHFIERLVPPREWFTLEVIARGYHFVIKVNGRTTVDYIDKNQRSASGFIALQMMRPPTVVEFRKIEIQELPTDEVSVPASRIPAEKSTPWVPLFNGNDLTGWKTHPSQPGNWQVERGFLIGRSEPLSHLFTDRGDWGDFHLRAEVRINAGGNSGILFRCPYNVNRTYAGNRSQRYPYGYEAQIESIHTGNLIVHTPGNPRFVAPRAADNLVLQPGEWFTYEVIAKGRRFILKVNGTITADYEDPREGIAKGHIVLQIMEKSSVVEVRNIEIKEFPQPPPSDARVPSIIGRWFNEREVASTHEFLPGGRYKYVRSGRTGNGRWSQEGDRVVFEWTEVGTKALRKRSLRIMSADGTKITVLVNGERAYTWKKVEH